MAKLEGITPPFIPAGGIQGLPGARPPLTGPQVSPFKDLLDQAIDKTSGLKFSAHAQSRLNSRQVHLGEEEIARLGDAVDRAEAKGARESLILLDQSAFIVNIPNRTVITAMDRNEMNENVFTNIDSAVIVEQEKDSTQ